MTWNTIVAVTLEPLGSGPTAHWRLPETFEIVPWLLVTETRLRLGGGGHRTRVLRAVERPRLVRAREFVRSMPVRSGGVPWDCEPVRPRSQVARRLNGLLVPLWPA